MKAMNDTPHTINIDSQSIYALDWSHRTAILSPALFSSLQHLQSGI